MAYLETARLVRRPKFPNSALLFKQADREMPPALYRELRRHITHAQEMLLVGLLAAGAILAIAGAMLLRL